MIRSRMLLVCLLAALVLLIAPAAWAQACPSSVVGAATGPAVLCPVVAVGSAVTVTSAEVAAASIDPTTGNAPLCGSRLWSGTAFGKDARAAVPVEEHGNIWVAWDVDTAPTIVCAYLVADSIEGQRLFFGQGPAGNGTIDIPTAACTTPAGNKFVFVWDTDTGGLPVKVWDALMGANATLANCSDATTTNPAHFNVAFTEVRAEDAKYIGSDRNLCPDNNLTPFNPPDAKACLGFGPASNAAGVAVASSFSPGASNSYPYNITGADPLDPNALIPSYQQVGVGAASLVILVNTIDTSTAGFGSLTSPSASPRLTNANSHELSGSYSGSLFFTRDILRNTPNALPEDIAHFLVREPAAGAYLILEWQVVRQRDGRNDFSQETGICAAFNQTCYNAPTPPKCTFVPALNMFPGGPCDNPMSYTVAGVPGLRTRVVNDDEMINVANTTNWITATGAPITPSILGYSTWTLGKLANNLNIPWHIKWLTLDGSDPLLPHYAVADGGEDGQFPGDPANQAILPNPAPINPGQCGGYFNVGLGIEPFSCNGYTLPTFDNIQNGTYRAWNIVRAVYYGSAPLTPSFAPLNVAGFILGTQDQAAPVNTVAHRVPDFVPTSYCVGGGSACPKVVNPLLSFRSHYSLGGLVANNGVDAACYPPPPELGGDVGGAVFGVQDEMDTCAIASNSFLVWIQ